MFDDQAFSELSDPRVRLLIDLLSRNILGEEIPVTLGTAGLNPGDYPLVTAKLAWTTVVPDAARLGKLGSLVGVVAASRPAFARELERQMSELLHPVEAGVGWYRHDDPYSCSFVGLRSARA